jgi:DNA-binding NtrC family response regulator/tetratricopeptide (TPR) repeat protein
MQRKPDTIGSYKPLRLLGRGPRGVTWLATEAASPSPQRSRPRRKVLKVLDVRPERPADVLRSDFAELLCWTHPALAMPDRLEIDPSTGQLILARPYIDGFEIATATRGMATPRIVRWVVAAARALAALHRAGIAHRSLEAENFIVPRSALSSRPNEPLVVLCDPAWWRAENGSERGDLSGRLSQSPEGSLRQEEVELGSELASDLVAFGGLAYRLLTGERIEPRADTWLAAPVDVRPDVPLDLSRIVLSLLHPDAGPRFADAVELARDLEGLAPTRHHEVGQDVFRGDATLIDRALDPITGDGSSVIVRGEIGSGKSCFLRRVAASLQVAGVKASFVSCRPSPTTGEQLDELIDSLLFDLRAGADVRARLRELRRETLDDEARVWAESDARGRYTRGLAGVLLDAGGGGRLVWILDDIHLASDTTLALLVELARRITARSNARGHPRGSSAALESCALSLVVAVSSETPCLRRARSLLDVLESAGASTAIIELDVRDSEAAGPGPVSPQDHGELYRAHFDELDDGSRRILEVLSVLGRAAAPTLIARATSARGAATTRRLRSLIDAGILVRESNGCFFRHGSYFRWVHESLEPGRLAALRSAVASALRVCQAPIAEVAMHCLGSDRPWRGVRLGIEAARDSMRRHDCDRALELYRAVEAVLSAGRVQLRRVVRNEIAECSCRAGRHGPAVEILESLLEEEREPVARGRLLGRLGVSLHRLGEVHKATRCFLDARELAGAESDGGGRTEPFWIEAELAEIACNRGDYAESESICVRALETLARLEGEAERDVLKVEMVLLETLAHCKLRRFQYEEAEATFLRSLTASEAIGAAVERSLILNNLGIVYNQQSRFARAIAMYEEAAKSARRRSDDYVLVGIESNLAMLHAKTGHFDRADAALERATQHEARSSAARLRLLRLHSAGIVDLLAGRLASAIDTFRAAIDIGDELGDRFISSFDLAFLGECHILRGESRAAHAALDRASGLAPNAGPSPLDSLIASRRALLGAYSRDAHLVETLSSGSEARDTRKINYATAWDDVYFATALAQVGRPDAARGRLRRARAFFRRAGVPAGENTASLELARVELDAGRLPRAEKILARLAHRFRPRPDPAGHPLLAARYFAAMARVGLDREPADLRGAYTSILEAESLLIGRRLRDAEVSLRESRRRIQIASAESRDRAHSAVLPARFAASEALWARDVLAAAAALGERIDTELEGGAESRSRDCIEEFRREVEAIRRLHDSGARTDPTALNAASLFGGCVGLREVSLRVRQIAPSRLPILVRGETGTGKELVARAIHLASGRRGPFVSIHCAALPEELLEAELFGCCEGAYTGAEKSREGLLVSAQGGTVLFDEIAGAPLAIQAKLLRVLDRGVVRPLGSTEEVALDVRYVFTSNADLAALSDEGCFRADLYYRLRGCEITLPPLRDHLEDLPILVERFRAEVVPEAGGPTFLPAALRALAEHSWPGNVRELQNAVTRLAIGSEREVTGDDVRKLLGERTVAGVFSPALLRSRPLPDLVAELETQYFTQLFRDLGGNLRTMAARLGVSRQALYKRFKTLGLSVRDLATSRESMAVLAGDTRRPLSVHAHATETAPGYGAGETKTPRSE